MNLLKIINKNNIVIYDKIENQINNTGYNLGDLLNCPYYLDAWSQNPHASNYMLTMMNTKSQLYTNSILNNYCNNRPSNENVPNIERLNNSILKYINNNNFFINNIYNFVQQSDILCVHVRSGDKGHIDKEYINIIYNLSLQFKEVILFSGIHSDERYSNNKNSINTLIVDLNFILQKNNNISVYIDTADNHISLMSVASNLLLHKGGFSIIGSLVCKGNIFLTNNFESINLTRWKELNIKYTLLNKDLK
jgi:hypothetical protein